MKRLGWVCDAHLEVLGHDVDEFPTANAHNATCTLCDQPGRYFITARAIDEIRAILADRKRQPQQVTP